MEFGVVIFKRIIALVTSEIKFRLATIGNAVVLQLYENCRACCVLGWVKGNASVLESMRLVQNLTVIHNPHLMTSVSSGELNGHEANEQQMVLLLLIQYLGHRNSK